MSNKTFFIILPIILWLSINHKVYGNSTISNFERLQAINYSIAKHRHARGIAKYMYNRIKYYQSLDGWWERQNAVWIIYQGLKKEGF